MSPAEIEIMAVEAEQLITKLYAAIQAAGMAPDTAAAYVARINAAAAAVPAPCVGANCECNNCG